jgi:hypothetical protein
MIRVPGAAGLALTDVLGSLERVGVAEVAGVAGVDGEAVDRSWAEDGEVSPDPHAAARAQTRTTHGRTRRRVGSNGCSGARTRGL